MLLRGMVRALVKRAERLNLLPPKRDSMARLGSGIPPQLLRMKRSGPSHRAKPSTTTREKEDKEHQRGRRTDAKRVTSMAWTAYIAALVKIAQAAHWMGQLPMRNLTISSASVPPRRRHALGNALELVESK